MRDYRYTLHLQYFVFLTLFYAHGELESFDESISIPEIYEGIYLPQKLHIYASLSDPEQAPNQV